MPFHSLPSAWGCNGVRNAQWVTGEAIQGLVMINLCGNLTGLRTTKLLVKVSLGEFVQVSLEEINSWISELSKEDSLSPMWGHHSILRDLKEQKTEEGWIPSFCLSWDICLLPLNIRAHGSPAFRLRQDHTTVFPGPPLADSRSGDFSASITMNHIFMASSSDLYTYLPSIYLSTTYHLSIYLSTSYWPISLGNPD